MYKKDERMSRVDEIQFGQRLSQLRHEKRLKQEELAAQFYISKSSISTYERGGREPTYKLLVKFARFFNVTTDYLLGVSNQRHSNNLLKKAFYDTCTYEEFLDLLSRLGPSSRHILYETAKKFYMIDKNHTDTP